MGLIRALWLLCLVADLRKFQIIPCSEETKSVYSFNVSETDPVGTDLCIRVAAGGTGEYWQLQLKEARSFEGELVNRSFFTSAFQFEPSEAGRPLRCSYTVGTTGCVLKLRKVMDVEEIYARYKRPPPYMITLQASCKGQYSRHNFATQFSLIVTAQNEFPPTFTRPIVTVTFPNDDLVSGLELLDLGGQASDRDVGNEDGVVQYSVANGTNMIYQQGSKLVLRRSLARWELGSQGRLAFLVKATDKGQPRRTGVMTLVLRIRKNDNSGSYHSPWGTNRSSVLISRSNRHSRGTDSTSINKSLVVYGVGIPSLLVVITLATVVKQIFNRKAKKERKSDRKIYVATNDRGRQSHLPREISTTQPVRETFWESDLHNMGTAI